MSYLEEAAQKRLDQRQLQSDEAKRMEGIQAVTESGKSVVDATKNLAKTDDIDGLLQQVKEATLAQYLNGQKSTVVLTDQTDLGDKMQALGEKLASTVASLDSKEVDSNQLKAIKDLQSAISLFTTQSMASDKATAAQVVKAINAIKVSPVVNVPEPKVTVQPQKLDFTPLQNTIKEYFAQPETDKLDLECYRAQDISETDNMQYVGFVNPDGGWYIIENDTTGNSLRYLFGASDYSKAFKKASSYQYMLLNEAVNALSA